MTCASRCPWQSSALLLLAFTARSLDALTLGEQAARSMGVDQRRLQWLIVLGVGLCVGASVAAAGIIGFVGLMVPHIVRPLVGGRPSAILLPSALGGALLVLLADSLVRLAPTVSELRLGIAMSMLGGPFFLVMLHSHAQVTRMSTACSVEGVQRQPRAGGRVLHDISPHVSSADASPRCSARTARARPPC